MRRRRSGGLKGWLPDDGGVKFPGKVASAQARMLSGVVSPLEMGTPDLSHVMNAVGPEGLAALLTQSLSNQYMDEREVMNPAAQRNVEMARIGAQEDIAGMQDARLRDQLGQKGDLAREQMSSQEMLARLKMQAAERQAQAQQAFDIKKFLAGEVGKNRRTEMEAQGRVNAAKERKPEKAEKTAKLPKVKMLKNELGQDPIMEAIQKDPQFANDPIAQTVAYNKAIQHIQARMNEGASVQNTTGGQAAMAGSRAKTPAASQVKPQPPKQRGTVGRAAQNLMSNAGPLRQTMAESPSLQQLMGMTVRPGNMQHPVMQLLMKWAQEDPGATERLKRFAGTAKPPWWLSEGLTGGY
jgi:hypothetical protein